MIKDLYTRVPSDPMYDNSALETSNTIEQIVTKIKMILSTPPGTVLGDVSFGVGIEDLVFQTNVNKYKLEDMINSQIREYLSETSEYKILSKVSFGKTEYYDYCIVDITINDETVAGVLIA